MNDEIDFKDTTDEQLDLGEGFLLRYVGWAPDRSIYANAEKYADIPDIPVIGAIMTCRHGVEGVLHFDIENVMRVFPSGNFWQVISRDPITLSPSVDCGCCHGYIQHGKWVDC